MLKRRSNEMERMDTDCNDYADYAACLSDLARVNRLTLTHRPMLRWLRREAAELSAFSLLDVGCGQGDALRAVARWAAATGRNARLEGVDAHPWAIRAAREATPPGLPITFRSANVFDANDFGRYDFIVCSQFAHHLADQQIVAFVRWLEGNALNGWFIGDLHRHPVSYLGFPVLATLMRWHRFVRHDGTISIARAFRPAEWGPMLAAAGVACATVRRDFPFRIGVSRRCARR